MDYTLDEDHSTSTPSGTAYTDDYSTDYNAVHEDNGTFWQLFWEDHNRTLMPDNATDFFYHDLFLPDPADPGDAAHNAAASPGVHATLQCSLCWMIVGLWACCLLLLFRRLLLPPS